MDFIVAGGLGAAVIGILSFLGGGAAAAGGATAGAIFAGITTVASIAYTAFSGYQAYKQQQDAKKAARLSNRERSSYLNYREPIPTRRIVYGRVRVGGPLIFAHSPKSGEVHMVVALASHQIEEIESVWVGREQLSLDSNGNATGKYSGVVKVHKYLGAFNQNVSTQMIAEGLGAPNGPILSTDKFAGIACLYVILNGWAKKFAGDEPEFSAIIKGKNQILRGDFTGNNGGPPFTIEYTDNPIDCVRDYLANYVGAPYGKIEYLQSEVDYCNALIPLKGGGTEKRFTCNGLVLATQRHDEVLEALANSFAGNVRFVGGKWRITSKPADNTAFRVSEDDMLKTYEYSYNRSARDLPNAIRGSYVDPTRNWQPTAFPILDLSGAGKTDYLDLELLFTSSHTMAQRISKTFLYRARAQSSTRLTLTPRALKTIPGEVIEFQSQRLGFTRDMEVMDMGLAFGVGDEESGGVRIEVMLGLQQYDGEAYEWNAATEEQDLEVGEVDLGGILNKLPENVTAVETLQQTTPDFETELAFSWNHPSTTPEGSSLDDTRLEVVLEITTDDGNGNLTTTAYQKEKVQDAEGNLPGAAKTYTFTFDQNLLNGPGSYVSHTIITKRLRTIFSDGTRSEWVNAA